MEKINHRKNSDSLFNKIRKNDYKEIKNKMIEQMVKT